MNSHKQTGLRSLLVASPPPPPPGVLRWAGSFACAAPRAAAAAAARSLAPIELATGGFTPYCCPRRLPAAKLQSEKKNKPSGSRHTRHFTPIFLGALPPPTPRARERERESLSAEYLNSPEVRPWVPRAPSHPRSHRLVLLLLLRGAEPARLSPPLVPPTTAPPKLPPTRASHRLPGPFAQPALNIGSSHGRSIPETIRLVAQDLLVSSGRGRQCGGRPRGFLRGSLPARVASRPSSPHRENRS